MIVSEQRSLSTSSTTTSKRIVYSATSEPPAGTNKRRAKTAKAATLGADSPAPATISDSYTNSGFDAELATRSDLLERPRRTHHDTNADNAADSSKVRLLVRPPPPTPPAPAGDMKRASEQQQMARARSPAPPPQIVDCQQRNYHHHYDYYTDSDLTSSQPPNQANHCNWAEGENVRLFATEHNANHQQPPNQRQQIRQANNGGRHFASARPAVGRFVNYYPSWRESGSSASQQQHQNYSFHVPLSGQLAASRPNLQQTPVHGSQQAAAASNRLLYQARYGFLAPATDERLAAPEAARPAGFRQSFRSRTIGHIPNMVGMSVEEARAAQADFASGRRRQRAQEDEQQEETGNNYEDFYEKSTFSGNDLSKQFVVSEGNLLRASMLARPACDVRKSVVLLDDGQDNPFKPNTELSWEADMMVRLMRRGYPLEELPVLVQTAKELALEKPGEPAARRLGEGRRPAPFRRQASTGELSSAKRIWASSLSRAKSMPRFGSPSKAAGREKAPGDSDSIDKLIASIEDEMSELLRLESDRSRQANEPKLGQEASPTANSKPAAESRALESASTEKTIKKIRKQKTGGQKVSQLTEDQATKTTVHSTSETSKQVGVKNRVARAAKGGPAAKADKAPSSPQSVGSRADNRLRKKKRRNGCCIIQ